MSTSDSSSLPFTSLFINGQWAPSSTSSTFTVHNPSSPSSPVGHSASASPADCTSAITAAATAFRTWEHTSLSSKRSIFLKAAELLASERYKRKVIEVTQSEIGAVEPWILGTWAPSVEKLKWTAGCVNELRGETFPSDFAEGAHVVVQRRAMGVVFAIAPWNAPLILAFTGSDRVGKILAAEAAKYLKPCVFELGGKAPCVVLEDADIPSASRAIAFASMINSGQVCMSTEIGRVAMSSGYLTIGLRLCLSVSSIPSTDSPKPQCLHAIGSPDDAGRAASFLHEPPNLCPHT
ncbi:hypothetical protein JAAARDRAFT_194590 [Jaapia argillacea MUCL 33604]|uniref:Aldehyde dehydrogenase domain-containing protein n=1 Tax=Jaapia argillacea MUCL 33604 TaxID=933084 RepID=A0A067PRY6_9AGAM|nr:hypothetical protein JAAARDRAFT_194590 [Jaapia argillacea MUCL 33604]